VRDPVESYFTQLRDIHASGDQRRRGQVRRLNFGRAVRGVSEGGAMMRLPIPPSAVTKSIMMD
jgi:hypothetical protein